MHSIRFGRESRPAAVENCGSLVSIEGKVDRGSVRAYVQFARFDLEALNGIRAGVEDQKHLKLTALTSQRHRLL